MKDERAIPLPDWPKPNAGAPLPEVFGDDATLSILYWTASGKYAVIHFPLCWAFSFGAPNDDALEGHPLYGKGLEFYSVHLVENSSWLSPSTQEAHDHFRGKMGREPDGAANGCQPIRTETNPTSSAAGSRR